MYDFFLELLIEEIPSRFQDMACVQLREKLDKLLKEADISFSSIKTYVTPRRLIAHIQGLPEKQEDKKEIRKGPRIDAPQKATEGFLKSLNITLEDCGRLETEKGIFLQVEVFHKGKKVSDILKNGIEEILTTFSWPKSMRWGSKRNKWVRPLRHILAVFNSEVLDIEWNGVKSSNKTQGHRFLYSSFFEASDWASYKKGLEEKSVILDKKEKINKIKKGVTDLAKSLNFSVQESSELINEVAGLVEYPWFLKGDFDKKFLNLPKEVLETTMRVHQRYFLLHNNEKPAASFIVVTNMPTEDHDVKEKIKKGNEKVLKARLEDAVFYWDIDQRTSLEDFSLQLKDLLFHKDLGTMWQKKHRLEKLLKNKFFCQYLKENKISNEDALKAAELCKADLCTGVVSEFPELQGIIGSYYSKFQGKTEEVSKAIREHYSPTGPETFCPKEPLSVALSLIDKVDTLVGFFAINLGPTGSKDPFALRRSALGLLRLILSNKLDFRLSDLLKESYKLYVSQGLVEEKNLESCLGKIQQFLKERFKYYLKDKEYDHKLIEAVLFKDSFQEFFKTLNILVFMKEFFKKKDGEALLQTYRRINNILPLSEYASNKFSILEEKLSQKEEIELNDYLKMEKKENRTLNERLKQLISLQEKTDLFFDSVFINDPDEEKKHNRYSMLYKVRDCFDEVLDFSSLVK